MESKTSPLIQFYLGYQPYKASGLSEGLLFKDVLKKNDKWLEDRHDYIQWLFPLKEASNHNFHAPILTDADIKEFKNNPEIQKNFHRAFVRMLDFYGFAYQGDEIIVDSPEKMVWVYPDDHNLLRITRILGSSRLVSAHANIQRDPLIKTLDGLVKNDSTFRRNIPELTLSFWWNAPFLPPELERKKK